MPPPIVFDFFRLFLGAAISAPRGIDRADLGYARFFFHHWPGDCVGTLATPWGVRLYDRQRVISGLDRLEALWSEAIAPEQDSGLARVKALLSGAPAAREGRAHGVPRPISGFASLLSRTGFSFGASAARSAPRGSIYLNVGQLCWAMPYLTAWLRRRPDIKSVFMVHDVIPLEQPDIVWRGGPLIHRMMINTVARQASGIIVPSAAARESILNQLRLRGRTEIAVATLAQPVADVFLEKELLDPALRDGNYFVVCGAIEPRKNHRLLFEVWQELVRQRGDRAPKLVVIGALAKGGGPILDELAQCAPLRAHVIVASGLSSPAYRRLVVHAKALLMPSLAEGFGLPVIEALAAGTPVIASTLPSHRESAGDLAVYCDPHDAAAWLEEICAFTDASGAAPEFRRRIATYQPQTERAYFGRVESFLRGLDRR
jgi:glycosyltransferase involved in cell wall biosynthesis